MVYFNEFIDYKSYYNYIINNTMEINVSHKFKFPKTREKDYIWLYNNTNLTSINIKILFIIYHLVDLYCIKHKVNNLRMLIKLTQVYVYNRLNIKFDKSNLNPSYELKSFYDKIHMISCYDYITLLGIRFSQTYSNNRNNIYLKLIEILYKYKINEKCCKYKQHSLAYNAYNNLKKVKLYNFIDLNITYKLLPLTIDSIKGMLEVESGYGSVYRYNNFIYKVSNVSYYDDLSIDNELDKLYNLKDSKYIMKVIKSGFTLIDNDIKQYYITEYYGDNLYDFIKRNNVSDIDKSKIIKQLIIGLYDIHKENIIHNDIKPHNILYNNGNVYYIDFGLSFYDNEYEKSLKVIDIYSPLEYKNKDQKVSFESDIWRLGLTFLFIMKEKILTVMRGIKEVKLLKDKSNWIEHIITRMLSDVKNRISIKELILIVNECCKDI